MAVFSIIPTSEMTERFDAEFYTPNFLVNDKKLKSMPHKKLSEILQSLQLGYTGPTEKFYEIDGINYLSSKNIIDGNIVITDATDTISTYAHRNDLKRTSVQEGDVLISRTGSVGKSAIVTRHLGEANIAAHLIALRIKKGWDSYYLSAFLNSFHGRQQSQRHQRGTIIQGLSVYDVPLFYIPLFTPVTQKYIGDKVRQAEELRNWAKSTQKNANTLIPAYINEIERYQHKSYRTAELNPERLDSLFYHPDYIALESKMKSKGCKKLGLIATLIKQAWDKKRADVFEYFEIGGLDINTGQVASVNTETSSAPSRAKTKVQQGDVLVSTVRPNRKNVGFIIKNANDVEMVATSGFSVLRFSSLKEAAFYHAWLRTDDATSQLMRWNSGSAYPAIDDNVPLNIIVPEFDKDFIDEWGQKLLDAQFAYVYAKQLTNAAKTLVEALIEGQLTEEQLIQAQQALEDGDNTLDKAILSKLSSEGYAVEGATPLFSDIDELYSLLASATAADSED